MINICTFTGNLTREPELRQTPNGHNLTDNVVAVNYKSGELEHTEFVNFTIWGKGAENFCKFCKKGQPVLISGRMETQEWEKEGVKNRMTKIVVSDWQMFNKRNA